MRRSLSMIVFSVGLTLLVTLSATGTGVRIAHAEDRRTTKSVPASASRRAEPGSPVEQKLEQVLAKQDEILQRLDKVIEELQIVKIRASH